MAWLAESSAVKCHCPLVAKRPCMLFESYLYESRELPVIGGFGVTGVVGRAAGVWKTDFTCLITDVRLATRPLPGCNYGLRSHRAARPTRST